ncbi:tripartite tricarboxylate transporter substrate binding protein [Aureimonas fodinaquatilis]|uniref:Tripartite tricarboxylate transporter substrate binding protein n=1 Tax=Aureimonas fodinaquatilis TaxID=2565783 RepID=A0A5B0E028_9HYPH|nr:tripartite tricarboxylate transporter substrate binding protein [Aureimonas fodinaquatilis]KAA0971642.1 tripartite tricarboxylate transporter substrate binding protein [Aureimonas fodinaquatilis]
MSTRRNLLATLAAVLMATGLSGTATAQDYPSRPITLIVPYGAGGGTDLTARVLAAALEGEMGRPVVVENRAGGGGAVGLGQLYNARPDGYTLGIGTGSNTTIAPNAVEVAYDPAKFSYIGNYFSIPFMVIVNPELPVNNLEELEAYGKANPGGLIMSTSGGFGIHDVGMAMLAENAGQLEYRTLPNESAAQTTTRMISGDANITFSSPATNMEHVKAGTLRAIAIISDVSVPEMDSLGLERVDDKYGFALVNRTVLLAPPGLPEDIRSQLEAAMAKVMDDPALVQRVADLGYVAQFKDGATTQAETVETLASYGDIIKRLQANQ